MFNKVLIANRGEIAVRVIRACQELDLATVAVYSDADEDSFHVHLADEAYRLGPAPAAESYLSTAAIIEAAIESGAGAIHPGYGFLAENPSFAEACSNWGIKFIGPWPDSMRVMGLKSLARQRMMEAGVPVIEGTDGVISNPDDAAEAAQRIGYPVILKAAAGGGGRGIRLAHNESELRAAIVPAEREAVSAFGDGSLYLEKYLDRPRHIEVQVLADEHGNLIHLGERESSLQRRRQKLIEEAPSTALTPRLRQEICQAGLRAAEAVNYVGAGTVEFLLDSKGRFYFMEMNTRIQVEHPTTEMITGVDLVKEQLRVAAGKALSISQDEVRFWGWAIECRINAENPASGFSPSPGIITKYREPGGPGVRVDSYLQEGTQIQCHYDSLIAKVITWGRDREEAVVRMRRALGEFVAEGIVTTIPAHKKVMRHPEFLEGRIHTGTLDSIIKSL